jgi:MFS family permease
VLGWLRHATGGLPRQFWFLWAGTLIYRLGSFVVIYLAIYLTQRLGFSQSRAGLVLGCYGIGGIVGTLTGGVLADRWGRRSTLLTAQVGAATLMLALGFARGFWQLALGAMLLGVFAEAVRPPFQAMMIDIIPDRDRIRAFSLSYWAVNLGFACAAILAGFAAQFDYLLLFVVDAGTTLITASITLFFLTETRPTHLLETRPARARQLSVAPGPKPGLGTVFRDRIFVGFLILNLFGVLILMQHMSTLPIAMSADGLSPATFGWVVAVNGLLIVAGQLFVPRLIGGHDRSRVLALGTTIVGLGFGLGAFADTAWFYAFSVVIWTLGEMLQSPSNAALIASLSPAALRGRYQGINSLSWSAGTALAPIAGGFVQEHLGSATLWLSCAGIGVLAALGQVVSGPARERRAAALRAAETPAATESAPKLDAVDTTPPTSTAEPAAALAPVSVPDRDGRP